MENNADTPVQETNETPAAEAQDGIMVPKWRLDELASRNRMLQEEVTIIKDTLRQQAPQHRVPQDEDDLDVSMLGLDEQQLKVMNKLIERSVSKAATPFKHALGQIAHGQEETRFLMDRGQDKAKYLDQIRVLKQQYAQNNSYISVADAYRLIRADEVDRMERQPRAAVVQPKAETNAPPPTVTQQTVTKEAHEMSLEELEASLEGQFQAGKIRL